MIRDVGIVAPREAAPRILEALAQQGLLLLSRLVDVGPVCVGKKDFVLGMTEAERQGTEMRHNVRGMMDVIEVDSVARRRRSSLLPR